MKTRLSERDWLVIEVIICALPFLYYAMIFNELPAQVPVHYDIHGVADRFVHKLHFDIFLQCSIGYFGIIVGAGLKKLVKSLGKHETQDNTETSKKIMIYTQAGMAIFFTVMSMYFLLIMQKRLAPDAAHIWRAGFLVFSLVFIVTGNLLPKLRKNSVSGVRTSYSMSGDDEWMRAQRFGGRAFILGGIAMLLVSILPMSNSVALIINIVLFVLMVLAIIIHGIVKRK